MALSGSPFGSIFTFTRASVAQDFDLNGALVQSAINAIRQGYDPATLAPAGWLLEGAATNLFPLQTFANASAGGASAAADPSGALTAQDFIPNTASGSHYIDRGIAGVTAGTTTSVSVFLKAGNASRVRLHQYGTGNATFSANFDLVGAGTAGAIAVSAEYTAGGGSNIGAFIQSIGGGWYRCSLVGVPDTAATTRLCRVLAYDPTGVNTIFVGDAVTPAFRCAWPQLEANYYASSYIPTPAGSAVRAVDVLSITSSNFAQIFGASAPSGWVIADVLMPAAPVGIFPRIIEIHDGTLSNRIGLLVNGTSNRWEVAVTLSGSTAPQTLGAVQTPDTLTRVGLRWGGGSVSMCTGGSITSVASATPTGLIAVRIGDQATNGRALNGRIRGIWAGSNGSVSDAKFQAACTPNADVDAALRS